MGAILNRRFFSSPTIADFMTFLHEEDEYWDEVLGIMINKGATTFHNTLYKQPCRTRPFTGHQIIMDISQGLPDRGYQYFRMSNTIFIRLRDELVEKGLIQGSRHLTVDEQLGIFLFAIGHGVTNRVLAETFQHSGETISRYFTTVLRGVVELRHEYIQMPTSNVGMHQKIRYNPLLHPFKVIVPVLNVLDYPFIILTNFFRFDYIYRTQLVLLMERTYRWL